MESRFNEPLYNEVLGITNNILQPGQSYSDVFMEQNLDITNPDITKSRYNEHIREAQT